MDGTPSMSAAPPYPHPYFDACTPPTVPWVVPPGAATTLQHPSSSAACGARIGPGPGTGGLLSPASSNPQISTPAASSVPFWLRSDSSTTNMQASRQPHTFTHAACDHPFGPWPDTSAIMHASQQPRPCMPAACSSHAKPASKPGSLKPPPGQPPQWNSRQAPPKALLAAAAASVAAATHALSSSEPPPALPPSSASKGSSVGVLVKGNSSGVLRKKPCQLATAPQLTKEQHEQWMQQQMERHHRQLQRLRQQQDEKQLMQQREAQQQQWQAAQQQRQAEQQQQWQQQWERQQQEQQQQRAEQKQRQQQEQEQQQHKHQQEQQQQPQLQDAQKRDVGHKAQQHVQRQLMHKPHPTKAQVVQHVHTGQHWHTPPEPPVSNLPLAQPTSFFSLTHTLMLLGASDCPSTPPCDGSVAGFNGILAAESTMVSAGCPPADLPPAIMCTSSEAVGGFGDPAGGSMMAALEAVAKPLAPNPSGINTYRGSSGRDSAVGIGGAVGGDSMNFKTSGGGGSSTVKTPQPAAPALWHAAAAKAHGVSYSGEARQAAAQAQTRDPAAQGVSGGGGGLQPAVPATQACNTAAWVISSCGGGEMQPAAAREQAWDAAALGVSGGGDGLQSAVPATQAQNAAVRGASGCGGGLQQAVPMTQARDVAAQGVSSCNDELQQAAAAVQVWDVAAQGVSGCGTGMPQAMPGTGARDCAAAAARGALLAAGAALRRAREVAGGSAGGSQGGSQGGAWACQEVDAAWELVQLALLRQEQLLCEPEQRQQQ